METYTFLRELADSWVLLALTLFFLGTIAWSFRPGSRDVHAEIADIPFRNDTAPCTKNCPDCVCKTILGLTPEDKS